MSKTDLSTHPVFKHLPAGIQTRADSECSGCPIAATAGHETCSSWRPSVMAADANKMNLAELIQWQWQVHRRELDARGVPASTGDPWWPFSAKDSVNFADAGIYEVTGVSGTQITLTALTPGDEQGYPLYSYRGYNEVGRPIIGYVKNGCVQPGDVVAFSSNSKLSSTCWPVVVRVIDADTTAHTLTLELDKAPTGALSVFDGESATVTCAIYQHAGNPEDWQFIVKPDYFYGSQQIDIVELADIETDGVYVLNATEPVMHPGGFDDLHPTWTFEGKLISDGTWESVPQANDRLFITPASAQVSFKTTKPAEAHSETAALTDDLTVTYNQFRITYWKPTTVSAGGCSIVGFSRCIHSVPDYTASVGNYGASDGVGTGADGIHYVCLKRRYETFVESDSNSDGYDDTATPTTHAASGATRYPANGQCLGHGTCDQWETAEGNTGKQAPFQYQEHAPKYFFELWAAANYKKQQLMALAQVYQIQRIKHPSLAWLTGYYGNGTIATGGGIHPQADFGTSCGAWGGEPVTVTDGGGDQSLVPRIGTIWDYDGETLTGTPSAGHFPRLVTGFDEGRDPIDSAVNTYATMAIERIGWRCELDTGELSGRGISGSTVACAAQNVVIPNVETAGTGTQTRAGGTFERLSSGTGDGVVTLAILRQETKSAVNLGSRKVYSVTSLGSNRYEIVLQNGRHAWGQLDLGDLGEIGDSYDKVTYWNAGGAWPIVPPDYQQVYNYYEEHKGFGSTFAGAERGDSIGIGTDRFVIESVEPFGGAAAATWGSRRESAGFTAPGFYEPSGLADGEMIEAPTTGDFVKYNGGAALTRVEDDTLPAVIATGTFWKDPESNRIHFAQGDAGVLMDIRYLIIDEDPTADYTDTFTPAATYQRELTNAAGTEGILVTDWNNADTVTVTCGGASTTAVTGPDATGEYELDITGTYVQITTALADAGREWLCVLDFSEEATPPQDSYTLGGNYLDYAKNMDVVTVYDEGAVVAGLMAGDDIDFYQQDAVSLPGATLEWGEYQADSWEPVAGAVFQHGTGKFTIPAAFFDGKPAVICFRATGVNLLDHRGVVSAAVYNKTAAAVESLQDAWVKATPVYGEGTYSFTKTLTVTYNLETDPETGCQTGEITSNGGVITTGGPGVQGVTVTQSDPIYVGSEGGTTSIVGFNFNSAPFGLPAPLRFLPDGTTIAGAKAVITSSGITRNMMTERSEMFNCDGSSASTPMSASSTTVTDASYTVVGFTSEDGFEGIGSVSGAANGSRVVDITSIVQAMFAERGTGKFAYGFGVLIMPSDVNGVGAMEDLIPATPGPTTLTGDCFAPCTTKYLWNEWKETTISWTGVSISDLYIRVQYPNEDNERLIIMPRWPSMKD